MKMLKIFKLLKLLSKSKSMGVMIAIDDFGAGYSNFERLLEFNPDILKNRWEIDKKYSK